MTREECLALGPTCSLIEAGRALDVSEPTIRAAYHSGELAEQGVRVVKLGRALRVVTADLWQVLGLKEQPPPAGETTGADPKGNEVDPIGGTKREPVR